ncbi:hypothetical protein ABIE71_002374 [Bradyrhizobium diazoefficiens]
MLDLAEMRRQITALRSRHSENLGITYLLNRLLIRIAYLSEPESAAHAEQLREAFAQNDGGYRETRYELQAVR